MTDGKAILASMPGTRPCAGQRIFGYFPGL